MIDAMSFPASLHYRQREDPDRRANPRRYEVRQNLHSRAS
jgi:hypothetical protein